ncbi:MAG: hypothetical protein Q8L27_01250 [archaeon]|nr:hypothetical protein [archaeon]
MVSTKITSGDIAEIDRKLKTYLGDMVKIEYLENCLRTMIPNDASRFCHLKLSELYANRLMYGPAAKHLESAADTAVTYKDKIDCYLKEVYYLIKMSDYLMIDKAFKKALMIANNEEKIQVKESLKKMLLSQADEYEKKTMRSHAAQIYERLIEMPITNEQEKKDLMAKTAGLNSKLGRLKEAIRYEQMVKRPIEPRRLPPEENVKKISFEDLGLDEVR